MHIKLISQNNDTVIYIKEYLFTISCIFSSYQQNEALNLQSAAVISHIKS